MDWAEVVRQVVEDARRTAGSGPMLARRLEESGLSRYSESGISNWVKGRAMPPADVLLATASIGGISLDERLARDTRLPAVMPATALADIAEEVRQLRQEVGRIPASDVADISEDVRQLRQEMGRLETLLIDLYAKTGQVFPHEPSDDDRAARRAVGP
jgi:hypothetical protein